MRGLLMWLLLIAPGVTPVVIGQAVTFSISSAQQEYLIGEHATLHIVIEADRKAKVSWPLLPDTFAGGLQLLRLMPGDSVQTPDGKVKHTQSIIISAFDSGHYNINNIKATVLFPGKTDPDTLVAQPFEMRFVLPSDQPDEPLRDIAGPMSVPITLIDLLVWFSYLLATFAVIYLIYRIYQRLRRNSQKPEPRITPIESAAPWEIALEALRVLQQSDILWVKGVKVYYIELTEILRRYIHDGLHVNAPEFTTSQTLAALKKNRAVAPDGLARLAEILRVGDLVKFATYHPANDVNHDLLMKALSFVQETAPAHLQKPPTPEQP